MFVGLYKDSKCWKEAEGDGLKVSTLKDTCTYADVIMCLLFDEKKKLFIIFIMKIPKKEMAKILKEIQTGQFAREWILENKAGHLRFN